MISVKKIVAVTLVTALCFIAMCIPSYAVTVKSDFSYADYMNRNFMIPSPEYPTAESLPYGGETLIYEIPKKVDGGYTFFRVYIRKDVDWGSTYSIWNGTTALLTRSTLNSVVNDFNFQFVSKAPIYFQTYTVLDADIFSFDFSAVSKIDVGNVVNGTVYPTMEIRGKLNGTDSIVSGQFTPRTISNSSPMIGGRIADGETVHLIPSYERFDYIKDTNTGTFYMNPGNFRYPSSSDLQSMRDDVINDSLGDIKDSIDNGVNDIIDSVTVIAGEIKDAINEGVSDILNAGSEIPSVDTNNDWMKDSVTKVNEWLNQLEAFEKQMEQNAEQNSENMNDARNFIAAFFEAIPSGLVAVLSLGLVMIVVVKIVGR